MLPGAPYLRRQQATAPLKLLSAALWEAQDLQERNRFKPVWCVEDAGMERRRRPSLDGKAVH